MAGRPKFLNNLSFVLPAYKRKPVLFARSLYFLFRRAMGKPSVRGMDLAVTYQCNLRCEHCNIAEQINQTRQEMGEKDIAASIKQLQEVGGFYVTFTGGEPLLALDKIKKAVELVGKRSMLFQIQTNGVLLTDELCRRLREIGIDNIQISFDDQHEIPDWHYVIEQKERQLSMLRKWGFGVVFTWLASHASVSTRQIADIIDFSNKYRVKIGINFAVPQGGWKERLNLLLTKEDSILLRDVARRNRYLYIDLQNNFCNYGCPAFSERLHINAYGDVQPCTFFQISFGNVKDEPLRTILERGRLTEPFSGFPDHCPPAENIHYIHNMLKHQEQGLLPVYYKDFFKVISHEERPFISRDKLF